MTAKKPPLFTIGYEQTPQSAVLDALTEAEVDSLVDVRAVSASRRPGFSKRQLAASLDEKHIGYLHLRGLGTPTDGRQAARSGRFDEMLRIFDAHLQTPQAIEEMDELAGLVRAGRRVCLLCYERDPAHCHRRRVAEIIRERTGSKIEHLIPPLFGK
jgi:uncharacterized protein (DUF488 family)